MKKTKISPSSHGRFTSGGEVARRSETPRRRVNLSCRSGECNPHAVFKDSRSKDISHGIMHHWTVAVTLNVRIQALVCSSTANIASLFAENPPIVEAMKMLTESLGGVLVDKVQKGVT